MADQPSKDEKERDFQEEVIDPFKAAREKTRGDGGKGSGGGGGGRR